MPYLGHIGLTAKRLYLAEKTYTITSSFTENCKTGVVLKARVKSTDINKHTHCTHHNHLADKQSNKNEYTKVYNMHILIKQNIKKSLTSKYLPIY